MMPRIALATTVDLPVPDADEQLLLPHLEHARLAAWDDPTVEWSTFDAVVLRSTWNYTEQVDAFLEWAAHVDQVSILINPLPVIRWNTDKRYLTDVAAAGIATVPTTFVERGQVPDGVDLSGHIVVKPSVGAGSEGAALFREDPGGARSHLLGLHRSGRTAMVQPYLDQVDEFGETALIYVGGVFSHAARKAPILSRGMTWSTGLYADEKVTATTADSDQRALADQVMVALGDGLVPGAGVPAYARVDVLPTSRGPVLLELELTEPSLFLGVDPDAPSRVAAALTDAAASMVCQRSRGEALS